MDDVCGSSIVLRRHLGPAYVTYIGTCTCHVVLTLFSGVCDEDSTPKELADKRPSYDFGLVSAILKHV